MAQVLGQKQVWVIDPIYVEVGLSGFFLKNATTSFQGRMCEALKVNPLYSPCSSAPIIPLIGEVQFPQKIRGVFLTLV